MKRRNNDGTLTWEIETSPRFDGMSCYVLPGAMYGSVVVMMASVGFKKADKPEDADLVVFIGGADVDPELYGTKRNVASHSINKERDKYEKTIYEMCRRRGIPMFGICRGMQFLHAMNGGDLWQNVDNHAGRPHYIVDLDTDVRVFATSLHHQMIMDNERLRIIAVAEEQISRSFVNPDITINLMGQNDGHEIEIEAAIYDETNCFMVQGHPEVGCDYYKSWTFTRLKDFLLNDVGVQNPSERDEDNEMAALIMSQIG